MIVETKEFESYEKFCEELFYMNCIKEKYKDFVFRGVVSSTYDLLPSALRTDETSIDRLINLSQIGNIRGNKPDVMNQIYAELQILERFYIAANDNGLFLPKSETLEQAYIGMNSAESMFNIFKGKKKWIFDDVLEIAALAQHYGLPTRMLDFTFDIFTALYFASRGPYDVVGHNENIVIWALKYRCSRYLPSMADNIPLKFIVPRYANNPNLYAQKGLLVVWQTDYNFEAISKAKIMSDQDAMRIFEPLREVDRRPIDEHLRLYDRKGQETLLYSFSMPRSEKSKIAGYLARQGYNEARLFPGYKGVVEKIKTESIRL